MKKQGKIQNIGTSVCRRSYADPKKKKQSFLASKPQNELDSKV